MPDVQNTDIRFYDVRKREFVNVPIIKVKKTTYGVGPSKRHAVKAKIGESKFTKFVTKAFWDSLKVDVI